MALRRNMPTRQAPRPGTSDERYARTYDPATGGWTKPITPAQAAADDACPLCGYWRCRCGQAR